MAFLGLPCHCGYFYQELSETERFCEACWSRTKYVEACKAWIEQTPRFEKRFPIFCVHNRHNFEPCKYCGEVRVEKRC